MRSTAVTKVIGKEMLERYELCGLIGFEKRGAE